MDNNMIVLLIRYNTYYRPVDDPDTGLTTNESYGEWSVLNGGFWELSELEQKIEGMSDFVSHQYVNMDFDSPRDVAEEFVKQYYPDMQVLGVGRLPDSRHWVATLEPKKENDKVQLPRVYYHSWITGPQGARFEIFKSNHSTEVINKTKSRLRYDQDVVKIYVVDGEPEDYDHKKERLEFYDIEENDNG